MFYCELCDAIVADTAAHCRDTPNHEEATFRPLEPPPEGFNPPD